MANIVRKLVYLTFHRLIIIYLIYDTIQYGNLYVILVYYKINRKNATL